jgi:succinate dehydrogenase / fumarate reductase, flavoprotein subunit
MGGVEVDPDTELSGIAGLYAVGECSGGMHGSNRLGGNSLSDLLVFGKRAGEHASSYVDTLSRRPRVVTSDVEAAVDTALTPLQREGGESPYILQQDLQAVMGDLVGIIRREGELTDALKRLQELKQRVANVGAFGGRRYNPGWHLALDLRNMMVVSECTAKAALEREESRGGHTREDFPKMDPKWRQVNLVCSLEKSGDVRLEHKPLPRMRDELITLFDRTELSKYLTDGELAEFDAISQEAK